MLGSNYAPPSTMGTKEYWDNVSAHKFALPQCGQCKEYHYYPRLYCPHCGSDQIAFIEVSGLGTLYSFSIVRLRLHPLPEDWPVPFVVGLVETSEGPIMMANIVNCEFDNLRIGMELQVNFDASPFPVFEPAK